jgi:hypothetical protein
LGEEHRLAGETSNFVKSHIINFTWRRHITRRSNRREQPTQLTTNQKAGSGPENGASTGINTELGCPPYRDQLNNPEEEDRDGLRNFGIYENRTTLLG